MPSAPLARLRLLRLDGSDAPADQGWLTDDEALRLQAMTSPSRRHSFLSGHWQARVLAGEWLQVDATRIGLGIHPDGRPRLRLDGGEVPLSLSLSHSGDWLAVAVATVAVGIDVELRRRPRDLDGLARFAFSPAEADYLRSLDVPPRNSEFLRLWALKEARGKRSGEGMQPARSRAVTALASTAADAEAISWSLQDGALALAIEPGAQVMLESAHLADERRHWCFLADAPEQAGV